MFCCVLVCCCCCCCYRCNVFVYVDTNLGESIQMDTSCPSIGRSLHNFLKRQRSDTSNASIGAPVNTYIHVFLVCNLKLFQVIRKKNMKNEYVLGCYWSSRKRFSIGLNWDFTHFFTLYISYKVTMMSLHAYYLTSNVKARFSLVKIGICIR